MTWYNIFLLICLASCLTGCMLHAVRLIRLGKPVDLSTPKGDVSSAVIYSFTGAMHPGKKESAFLHLPTYTAGIIYHLGTFLSLPLFFLLFAGLSLPLPVLYTAAIFLVLSVISGISIFIKRFVKKGLRELSNPDDYLSNLLVTIFQLLTASALLYSQLLPACSVWAGILLLYLPFGKLRHVVYFFAARYQLGFFFGWRGVWPPKQT
jgi:hypothetical protein